MPGFVDGDGVQGLERLIAPGTVRELSTFFPDPYGDTGRMTRTELL